VPLLVWIFIASLRFNGRYVLENVLDLEGQLTYVVRVGVDVSQSNLLTEGAALTTPTASKKIVNKIDLPISI
jgi:hypothetical protein